MSYNWQQQLVPIIFILFTARIITSSETKDKICGPDHEEDVTYGCSGDMSPTVLHCAAAKQYQNYSHIDWYKRQSNGAWLQVERELHVSPKNETLTFYSSFHDNSGVYQCQVYGISGEITGKESITLKIVDCDPWFDKPQFILPYLNKTVYKRLPGEDFTLSCRTMIGPCLDTSVCHLTWEFYRTPDAQEPVIVPKCDQTAEQNVFFVNKTWEYPGTEQEHILHIMNITEKNYGYYKCISVNKNGTVSRTIQLKYGQENADILEKKYVIIITCTVSFVVIVSLVFLILLNYKNRWDLDARLWYRYRVKAYNKANAADFEIGILCSGADKEQEAADRLYRFLSHMPDPGFSVHGGESCVNYGENVWIELNNAFSKVSCLIVFLSPEMLCLTRSSGDQEKSPLNLWCRFVRDQTNPSFKVIYVVLEKISDEKWEEFLTTTRAVDVRSDQDMLKRSIRAAVNINYPCSTDQSDGRQERTTRVFYKKLLTHLPPKPYRSAMKQIYDEESPLLGPAGSM